jgi:hypothetical protein
MGVSASLAYKLNSLRVNYCDPPTDLKKRKKITNATLNWNGLKLDSLK